MMKSTRAVKEIKQVTNTPHAQALVIGYRKGLCDALNKHKIPFVLWHAKILKSNPDNALFTLHKDIPNTLKEIHPILKALKQHGRFTHVIAGTEDAVVAAAIARDFFKLHAFPKNVAKSCHDKALMKSTLQSYNIPMTPFIIYNKKIKTDAIIKQLSLPVVIKEKDNSGGRGTVICHNKSSIEESLFSGALLEKFVDAKEASIESFVQDGKVVFTNFTSYFEKTFTNILPAHFDKNTEQQLLDLNEKVINALMMRLH